MTKITARKGIAFGAALALSAVGLTSSPAYAVESLATTLTSGTSMNFVTGATGSASLNTSIAASVGGTDDGQLSYRIENPDGATFSVKAGNTVAEVLVVTGSDAKEASITEYGKAVELADAGVLASYDATDNDVTLTLIGSDAVGVYTENNLLDIIVSDATTTNFTITVTAFIDTTPNNKIDSTEYRAAPITLEFYDETAITAVTSVITPVLGADNVQATIVTTPELNGEQLGADFIAVDWTTQGNANAVLATNSVQLTGKAIAAGTTTYDGTAKTWTSKMFLGYATKGDPFSGSAVTFNQFDAAASTAMTVTVASTGVVTAVKTTHGILDGWLLLNAFTATDDATPGGDESNRADAMDGYYAVTSRADANTFTFQSIGMEAGAHVSDSLESTSTINLAGIPGAFATVQTGGTYGATPSINSDALSAASTGGPGAAVADDTKATIAGTTNIIGSANETGSTQTDVLVRAGTKTVSVNATVYTALDVAVAAGTPVTVTLTREAGSAATVYKVNGAASPAVVYTDANGQVSFDVTTTAGLNADSVDVAITPQTLTGAQSALFDLLWATAAYDIVEYADVQAVSDTAEIERSVTSGGAYTVALVAVDQWKQKLTDAKYRLQGTASSRTSAVYYDSLDDGEATFVIPDGALTATTTAFAVASQELASGVWGSVSTITVNAFTNLNINYYNQTDTVTLNANGVSSADLSARTALLAAKASDTRLSTTAGTVFDTAGANSDETVNITGTVANSTTGAAKVGAAVTVSGDSDILFTVGAVSAFGSLTFFDADGTLAIAANSNVAKTNSVVTVSSVQGTKTVKVSFLQGGTNAGKTLTMTGPSAIQSGSTLQVVATLADVYGNGVDTDITATAFNDDGDTTDVGETSTAFLVTVTGPGISLSNPPTATLADGTVTVNRLLGQNDKGTIVITMSYDQNDDGDYTDATDLVTVKTITVGDVVVAASATKVNAGAFNGYVAVYAKGHKGSTISWKISGKWFKTTVTSDYQVFIRKTVDVGADVNVDIYITAVGGTAVKMLTKVVTTR